MSCIMKDLICEDLHIVLQVPPVMYMVVVLGASGCWQICKFDAHTENHHTHQANTLGCCRTQQRS